MKSIIRTLRKRFHISLWGKESYACSVGVTICDCITIATRVLFLTYDSSTWLMCNRRGRRQCYGKTIILSNDFIQRGLNRLPADGDVPSSVTFREKVDLMLQRCLIPSSLEPPS
jgi:hypothetical protein